MYGVGGRRKLYLMDVGLPYSVLNNPFKYCSILILPLCILYGSIQRFLGTVSVSGKGTLNSFTF